MSATARTLPLRVPIVPGEALDSWLEALARRHQVTVGALIAALGWPVPASPGGLVASIPGQGCAASSTRPGFPPGALMMRCWTATCPWAGATPRVPVLPIVPG